ncbi:LacI family DNA-binding transcriptional regulator [Thalassospira lucentensis]|uniref:LacI family DNA-binding transcriptional regulator n=1 Tax=Thalassospira lucentensis TaxID=168935 RepID=UPI00142DB384|nr:LacI family DNA-binding transcriptional regulator [Thalassospira lucentensis]NIZ03526.1 LacI family DNA-binding transcriptional regulator [Thalassospira lucentensis]
MSSKPTMRDVARKSGLSIATVSRVINFPDQVPAETAKVVTAAMAYLNYRPNINGRRLKMTHTRTVGVVVPTLANPVFATAVQGIEQDANAKGLTVLLTSSNYDPEREMGAVSALLNNRVDGLILTLANADNNPVVDLLLAEKIPFVLLFNQPSRADIAAISVDNAQSAYDITTAMIAKGHRSLAMVAGHFESSDRSRQRYDGFCRALDDAGIPQKNLVQVRFDEADLVGPLGALLCGPEKVTGVVCSTDMLAIAAMNACRAHGLSVPDDVSVGGIDGISVGGLITPKLCSAVQPTQEMGRQALAFLRGLIKGQANPQSLLLPHHLSAGESIGSYRGTDQHCSST